MALVLFTTLLLDAQLLLVLRHGDISCDVNLSRHIDTARYYQNEADVGKAVRMSGMPREEIFITTKIWISDFGYKQTQQVCNCSL